MVRTVLVHPSCGVFAPSGRSTPTNTALASAYLGLPGCCAHRCPLLGKSFNLLLSFGMTAFVYEYTVRQNSLTAIGMLLNVVNFAI